MVDRETSLESSNIRLILRQLRIHQWVKNVLLFVPLVTAHDFTDLFRTAAAFFCFSFLASAIYVVNDLFDLEADRQHPTKKHRPLASGALKMRTGIFLVALLLPLSFYLASLLSVAFLFVLCAYLLVNVAYNLSLKSKAIVDVLCLAFLYLLRILGGHAVTGIPLSPWLNTFAFFFFLSLALIKRYTEFTTKDSQSGRGYQLSDAHFIGILGLTSSAISILVFTLYLNSDQVTKVYRSPEYLWFFIPLLFYWISRLWLKAFRLQMHDDPIVFALRDTTSHWIAALLLLGMSLAK